ncbi:MAG TPA: type VI secretion system-associated FHA domain protein TagH [Steroidobacteraceae bacterium]|jgi:predicted component of type VI protein secretion system|nr:type VI secretion system-associated FHA domain protein TagH [Steroidobacteraceae bacterium]
MALRLKIVSDNAATAGEHARWTFGVNGGRIGRHTTNDWVLRDPDRYVSGRHAEIEHRGGVWLLRDTSTNGTFVNGSDEALGPDRPHQLSSGDRIRIGEYEIEVEITGSNDFPARESAPMSETDLDASFEVKSFVSTGRRERDALARPRQDASPPRPAAVPPAVKQPAAPVPPQVPSSRASEEQQLWPGLSALCRGAGIDPLSLPAEARAAALQQAGQLLRETLVGFTELARTRADFANEFAISSGSRRRDATGAFVRIAAVEHILGLMLTGRGPGEARAVDEIRAQFARARGHEIAMAAAMREAVAAVFEKLSPELLEEQLGRRAQGVAGPELQARLWNRYLELFRATVQAGDAGLPVVFLNAYARAYESMAAGGSARDPGERGE